MRSMTALMSLVAGLGLSSLAWAQDVSVDGAWVRGTVAAQKATGAFMTLTAPEAMRLVGASSPAAGVTEVHEMKMVGDMMSMSPIDALDLPAGQAVELKPGGYHIMLMGLKAPLAEGEIVQITLKLEGADGQVHEQQLSAPVKALTMPAMKHGH